MAFPLTKSKTAVDGPIAVVKTAYALTLTPEAEARLAEIDEAADYLAEQTALAANVKITDDETNAQGANLTVNLTKARKVLEDLREYYTKPLEAAKKQVIARFKDLGAEALKQEDRLRQEAVALWTRNENARREAETKRIADQFAAERKARALGKAAPKPIAVETPVEVERSTKTENGTLGITVSWGFVQETVQLHLVPEKYITRTLNKKAVDTAIDGGERNIPGITIKEMPRSAVR